MNLRTIVKNEIDQESSGVWVLRGHREFGYSDGQRSESYLERVLSEASDLSCASEELRRYIRDWSSEYHLTVARSQLFSGFKFDRSLKVLEVGCGCGAITRYLGETFDEVVSVEGSLQRARVARKRTRDLPGVSIICAPFQEISFDRSFDIIFCVGVLEYSASFVNAPNPYEAVLEYFSKLLGPNGTLIVAIENQFGLKYFGSAREDHLGVMFAGLEGYPEKPEKVRTFGRVELDEKLRKYFSSTEFYYPRIAGRGRIGFADAIPRLCRRNATVVGRRSRGFGAIEESHLVVLREFVLGLCS
jgi:SAM-dependent methyltransferase